MKTAIQKPDPNQVSHNVPRATPNKPAKSLFESIQAYGQGWETSRV